MTKFTNFFAKLISIVLGILILLNVSSIIANNKIALLLTKNPNNTTSQLLVYSLIALGGILMVVGIMALFKLINKLSDKGLTILAIVLIAIYSITTIANIFLFPTIPSSDSFYVQDYAIKMARGDINIIDGNDRYFGKYSNNNAVVLILYYLFKAFFFVGQDNLLWVGRIFNSLCIIGATVLFYFAIVKFTGKKVTATKFLLLSVLLPSVQFSSSWVYTATICMPFIGGIFLCGANLIKATTRKSIIINSAIIGVLSVVGYKVRPVVIFISLAGIICMFFWAFKDKKKLLKSAFSLAICAVVACTSFLVCKGIDNHYYTGSNKQFPITHWIAMSLKGNGAYDLQYKNKHEAMNSTEEINKDSIKDIKNTLNIYTPLTLFKHQYEKSSLMWSEGSVGYYTRQKGSNTYRSFNDYICGPKKHMLMMYCQMLWLAFNILIMVYLYKLFRNKSSKKDLLLAITLLGALVFYMIWEVKINYALPFVPIIIAMASMGGISIENKFTVPELTTKKCYKTAYITVATLFIALLLSNIYYVSYSQMIRKTPKIENFASVSNEIDNVSEHNKVLKQTFYADSDFNQLSFFSIAHPDNPSSKYKITLKNSKKKVIAEKTYSSYYTFEKTKNVILKLPKTYSPTHNEKFTLTIKGLGADSDYQEFNYSDSSQIDCLPGELKINGKPINGDLKFGLFYTERTTLMSLPAYLTLIAIIALAEILVYISLFKKKNYNLAKR